MLGVLCAALPPGALAADAPAASRAPEAGQKRAAADAWDRKGQAAAKSGRRAESVLHFKKAIALAPKNVVHVVHLAQVYQSAGQFAQGLRLLESKRTAFPRAAERKALALARADLQFAWAQRLQEQKRYGEAIPRYRAAVAIDRLYRPKDAALGLELSGSASYELRRYREAAASYSEALILRRALKDRPGQAAALDALGRCYRRMDRYEQAVVCYEQALAIHRKVGNRANAAYTLFFLGAARFNQGRPEPAVAYYEEAARIAGEIKDPALKNASLEGTGSALLDLADTDRDQGRFERAIALYERALPVAREAKSLLVEGGALTGLGYSYDGLSRFDEAILYHERALAVRQTEKNVSGEAVALNNLGVSYSALGRHDKAKPYFEQALALLRASNVRYPQGSLLNNLGRNAAEAGQYDRAVALYEQALAIHREVKNRSGEAGALSNLGRAETYLGRHDRAAAHYGQALAIMRGLSDRDGEGVVLENQGRLLHARGEYEKAAATLEQSLIVRREVKDRGSEGTTLSALMSVWKARGRARLAVFYGKQAVNAYQDVRGNLKRLDKETQKSYLATRTDSYRELADLLIAEGRLPEAQQVLGLLKEEEFFAFVRSDATQADALNGRADLTPGEAEREKRYHEIADRITAIGAERGALRAKRPRTDAEEKRLAALEADLTVANRKFQQFLEALSREFAAGGQGGGGERAFQVREAQAFKSDLRELGGGAVALYTLVGPDRYRVILVTPDTQTSGEYAIPAAELNRKALAFRQALQDPRRDPRPLAQELYRILVGPVAKSLEGARAETLMWSLDGTLRYLPVGALHDGEKYLVERYKTSLFTPASNARLKDPVSPEWQALGLGVSKAHGTFTALPGVADELAGIVGGTGAVLKGVVKMDAGFTEETMLAALRQGYPLVHIASHFQFRPGNETDSFLLLGDGGHLTLEQVKNLPDVFDGVELLTLSACDTATGGAGADGKEVEGFGMLAQRQGAKAVLATLWPVADQSTRVLMQAFYRIRQARPGTPKVEALRQAQVALLTGTAVLPDGAGDGRGAALVGPANGGGTAFAPDPKAPFAHPYYWAPFILIGNWK